ncbi:MAG: 1,4-alpha-glucan branching enzyme, partial [Alkalimonas sp.]|nr:1,4-alpha-glucan branching enzyme [Alkalimonas sp.]
MTSVVDLLETRCSAPFSLLGWQPNWQQGKSKGLLLRCYLPEASAVHVLDAKTGKSLGECEASKDQPGVFELALPRKRKASPYWLQVTQGQHQFKLIDPYQFQEEAFYAVHFVHSQPHNLYRQLGAQLIDLSFAGKQVAATRFAVYAPNASSVSLIGDMNGWDGRCHPMQRTDCGHWVLVVPEIAAGVRYKYEIKDASGHTLPHKADPLGFFADQYPSHASQVYDHQQYQWQDDAWLQRQQP